MTSHAAAATGASDGASNPELTVAPPTAAAATDATHNVTTLDTHAAAHAANTPATLPPLSKIFLTNKPIEKAYNDPLRRYKDLCDLIIREHKGLLKFETKCASRPDGARTLPTSIPFELVQKVRFTPVEGNDAFYAAEQKAIREAQATAIEAVYANLLSAKKRYIEHLTTLSDAESFVSKATSDYEQSTLADWFHTHDDPVVRIFHAPIWLPGSSTVQEKKVDGHTRAEYTLHFRMILLSRINAYCAERRMELFNLLQKRKEANAANTDAQEQVLKGATTGQTLAMLSQLHVDQAMKKKLREIPAHKPSASAIPSKSIPAAAAASPAARFKPQRAPAPDHRQPSIRKALARPPSFNIHPDATGVTEAAAAAASISIPSKKRRPKDRDDAESQQPYPKRQKRSGWNPKSVIEIPDSQEEATPMEEDDFLETPPQSDFHHGGGPSNTHRKGSGRGRGQN